LPNRLLAAIAAAGTALAAGPVEFGRAELERAAEARKLPESVSRIKTEVAVDPPESYRIVPGLIAGGDLRGVMYGLLDAAEQVRKTGRLRQAKGTPGMTIRGVRVLWKNLGGARERWPEAFRTLALNRFNRFNVVVSELAAEGPELDTLRFLSDTAAEYGVDFTLGVWMEGTPDGPAVGAVLSKVLQACPSIRSVQLRMDDAAATYAVRAVQKAGRRVVLETAAEATVLADAATSDGVAVRSSAPYPDIGLGARRGEFFWELDAATARLKGLVAKLAATRASGFEIELPEGAVDPEAAWLRLGREAYDSR
jgi:hypothetical protein